MTSKYKAAALARGEVRTSKIESRVMDAIEAIKAEMDSNDGIYPHNGGAVSKNEIARRAGIGKTTLFAPKQSGLNAQVDRWLKALKGQEVVGRTAARRSVLERAEAWKAKYHDLENSHRKTELDLQAAMAEYEEALTLIAKLQTENATLLEQLGKLSSSNISSIKKHKY
jgi:hypothetical protein